MASKIVTHAGSGLPMLEAIARRIDSLKKSHNLPRDFEYTRKSIPGAPELKPGSRSEISVISTEQVDRDREVVLAGGGDFSQVRDVFFAHNYAEPPVAGCISSWKRARSDGMMEWRAETKYPPKPPGHAGAWQPDVIWHLLNQNPPLCTGKSIGFLPLNIRTATKAELARRPELNGIPIIDKWAGLEYSIAPLASNPGTELVAIAKCARVIGREAADMISAKICSSTLNVRTVQHAKALIAEGKVAFDVDSASSILAHETLSYASDSRVIVDGVLSTRRLANLIARAQRGGDLELANAALMLKKLADQAVLYSPASVALVTKAIADGFRQAAENIRRGVK